MFASSTSSLNIVAAVVIYAVPTLATVMFASSVVILAAEFNVVPSKVNESLSSSSPSVPAKTTLPEVKSETLAVVNVASATVAAVVT